MRELLAKRDIQLTKSLGQNFLHDANQLERIANAAELTSADKVLEIGPGLGPLTELLLKKCGQVLAIELDGRLVDFLQERYTAQLADESDPQLELHHDDALKFLQREPRDWRDWKLVANLPYSVASPILVELSAGSRAPKMIVVTLQLEVAQRLMAPTDDDHYGILTLLVQLDFQPRGWFKIPPGCFFPSPEVDSACVCLVRRATPLLAEEQRDTFRRIVKKAFFAAAENDVEIVEAGLAEGKTGSDFCRTKNLAAGTRGEIKFGTVCGADGKTFTTGLKLRSGSESVAPAGLGSF